MIVDNGTFPRWKYRVNAVPTKECSIFVGCCPEQAVATSLCLNCSPTVQYQDSRMHPMLLHTI